jgi:DNA gyrase subunit A
VRGVKLSDKDEVASMLVMPHFAAESDERASYLKMRRAMAGDTEQTADEEEGNADMPLPQERYAEMSAAETLILTITAGGAGHISSSHDYPVRGRGGMGVTAWEKSMRTGEVIAAFPIEMDDQVMLATSKGQSIRVPVDGISFRSRSAGGVKVFNTGKNETVVSVARIADQGDDDNEEADEA